MSFRQGKKKSITAKLQKKSVMRNIYMRRHGKMKILKSVTENTYKNLK